LSFTFPTDSNNKAGAVKTRKNGDAFAVPQQTAGYDTGEPKRAILTPNTDSGNTFQMAAECESFDFMNYGPGDAYFKLDGVPTIDGADCGLLAEGYGLILPQRGTVPHFISAGNPKIQVIGYR
jgi:hypothetical protein